MTAQVDITNLNANERKVLQVFLDQTLQEGVDGALVCGLDIVVDGIGRKAVGAFLVSLEKKDFLFLDKSYDKFCERRKTAMIFPSGPLKKFIEDSSYEDLEGFTSTIA